MGVGELHCICLFLKRMSGVLLIGAKKTSRGKVREEWEVVVPYCLQNVIFITLCVVVYILNASVDNSCDLCS